jgi:hypothetical protein
MFRATALAAVIAIASAPTGAARAAREPLAAEVARWSALLDAPPAGDDPWKDVREGARPALAGVHEALARDRRLLALLRLGPVLEDLVATEYVAARTPEQRTDAAAFEAEWKRMAGALEGAVSPPAPGAFDGVRPAAVRAIGEAALPQARVYYDASLAYGRNTTPASGLFYLGAAKAARDYAGLARKVGWASPGKAPALRAIGPELEALEGEILAAYRPPLSIDRHRDFIVASATLKEARELDAAGLRYGALLRYLQASLGLAALRGAPAMPRAGVEERLAEWRTRLGKGGIDHSLGRMFVESAESDLEHPEGGVTATAAAMVRDVLPRYLAALGPAPRQAARAEPRVTVTLVRWPYT